MQTRTAERADGQQLDQSLVLYSHKDPESPRQEGILQRNFPSLRPLADRLHQSVQTLTTRVNSLIPSSADLRRLALVGGTAVMLTAIALAPGAEKAKAAGTIQVNETVSNGFDGGFHIGPSDIATSQGIEQLIDHFEVDFTIPLVKKDGRIGTQAEIIIGTSGDLQVGTYKNKAICGFSVGGADSNYAVVGFAQKLTNNTHVEEEYLYSNLATNGDKTRVIGTFQNNGGMLECQLVNRSTDKTKKPSLRNTDDIDRRHWEGSLSLGGRQDGTGVANLPTFISTRPIRFTRVRTNFNSDLSAFAVTPLKLQYVDDEAWRVTVLDPSQIKGGVVLVDESYPIGQNNSSRQKGANAMDFVLGSH